MILIGAYLPHYGFTNRLSGTESEIVIQFKEDFLGDGFFNTPEMVNIKRLLELSKKGLAITGSAKHKIGSKIEKLAWTDHFGRLMGLIDVLNDLAITDEYEVLNADGVAMAVDTKENDRMNDIYDYIRDNFKEHISLEDISDEVAMTVPAFCRYFRKSQERLFTKFVNEYRVVHASKLLAETSLPINEVSFESGFKNFSHFNKLFKEFTGKSPCYRKEFKNIILKE